METAQNTKKILKRQNQIIREVTRSVKKYKSDTVSVQTGKYYQARIKILQDLWVEFKSNHTILLEEEEVGHEGVVEYLESDEYYNLEELYLTTVSEIEERLEQLTQLTSTVINDKDDRSLAPREMFISEGDIGKENIEREPGIPLSGSFEPLQGPIHRVPNTARRELSNVKLPKVSLPSFDGEYQNWMTFRDLYEDMIHTNVNLSTIQKFHYLRTSITGKAEKLIQRYALTVDNYDVAWNELKRRYNNTKTLVDTQLETIFSLPQLRFENASEISDLIDTFNHSLETLRQLTDGVSMDHPVFVFWIKRCLPRETRKLWEDKTSLQLHYPEWSELQTFLENRFRALEALGISKGKTDKVENSKGSQTSSRGKPQQSNPVSQVFACLLCPESHPIWKCSKFVNSSIMSKKSIVKEKGLCWNCLSPGHIVSKCSSNMRCKQCNQYHHSLLHEATPKNNQNRGQLQVESGSNQKAQADTVSDGKEHATLITAGTVSSRVKTVLLPTALVNVIGMGGMELTCRALIDQGSQTSFITDRIAQQLKLRRSRSELEYVGVGASEVKRSKYQVNLKIRAKDQCIDVTAQVLKTLTGLLPGRYVNIQSMEHLQGIEFADPHCFEPGKIDLLLGADIYAFIILEGLKTGPKGSPIAQNTMFGWVLSGGVTQGSQPRVGNNEPVISANHITVAFAQTNQDHDLQKFWELEEIPEMTPWTDEDKHCEALFEETTRQTANGRYEVQLPWKQMQCRSLGSGKETAFRRLLQLERILCRDHELKAKYMENMQDYISKGHVERVDAQTLTTDATITYLPHQPVKKRMDGQLKIRIVFDASQKSETGVSLNDVLLTGPSLQVSIPRVIVRWRVYQWVFAADIQGMYRQILVAPKDRNCLRFLWRNDPAEKVQEWRLTRVVFGIAPAPYLALRTMKKIIEDYGTSFPLASEALSRETYVDDILTGADTIDEAIEKKKQLISLLKCGQFELHKWMTNNRALASEDNFEGQRSILSHGSSFDEVKTLGLNWNSAEDTFKYCINLAPRERYTKRTLLSDLFKIHDPLGWIGPVIVYAKIILQEIWLRNITWDEILPPDLERKWTRFRKSLPTLDTLRIPRWLGIKSKQPLYIHGFCDASVAAYGAVIYVRTSPSREEGESTLLIAKSKVAPIKTVTLPRLELCGAVLLARLLWYVKETFLNTVIEAAWTDSTIVLAWIRGRPRLWKTFVANRVSEIHERVGPHVWKHVPTKSNPADCLSRGLEPPEIIEYRLWWTGPDWLKCSSAEWPHQDNSDEVELEEKRVQAAMIVTEDQESDLEVRYSSLTRLLRITAYCLRFIRSIKVGFPQPEVTKELHTKEIQEALKTWIKVIQKRAFSMERSCIELGKPIPPRSSILSLNPFLDEDGLLRVGGRLKNSMLPTQQRHPIVLPRSGHIITLMVKETHDHTLHGGGTLMLSILRRRYWILRARNAVRSCIRRCVVCRRYRQPEATQLMGDLPAARVQSSRPFTHTGVDYCGPFDINIQGKNRRLTKAYVAIFVCFATKAVHLEVVMDLSSEAFIGAFRRFIARRGLCTDLYSDRGTNFVGADQQLQYEYKTFCKQIQPALTRDLLARGINWHFNPPSAPHFGGLWEAGVKSFKHHLRRVMGRALLSMDEFQTTVTQIEGCLNSRPLIPMSDNPEDVDALTPGHFIMAGPPLAHPEPTLLHLSPGRLARWQLTQRLVQGFWRRLSSEYLSGLQQRGKWRTKQENMKLNDLVLIKEPNLPPARWRLARIVDMHPGADGLVRVLTLRTATSIIQRPIVQVCPLLVD